MTRKPYFWKIKGRELQLGERTLIVGVLNVTPDSFSDGGKYLDPDRAFAHALHMEEQGADIIDIGAESTRPDSTRISAAEELRRLIPVLKRLRNQLTIPISVDTYKGEVAELAIHHGAEIINDPTGLTFDPALLAAVAASDAGLVLTHMRGRPETWAKLPTLRDAAGAIVRDLEATAHRARGAGIDRPALSSIRASGSASARSRTRKFWRGSANSPNWICRFWWACRASRSWRVPLRTPRSMPRRRR